MQEKENQLRAGILGTKGITVVLSVRKRADTRASFHLLLLPDLVTFQGILVSDILEHGKRQIYNLIQKHFKLFKSQIILSSKSTERISICKTLLVKAILIGGVRREKPLQLVA